MSPTVRKLLWTFLAIAIVLGGIWEFYPLPNAKDRMEKLPLVGDFFKGQNVPLSDFEKQFFKGIDVIKRVYLIDKSWYFVSMLDGSNNRHLVHDPRYCFRGSGWTILSEKRFPLPHGEGSLVALLKDNERREAIYWFSDGIKQYSSPMYYWWNTTLRRLSLGRSGPEPILIIIQPLEIIKPNWNQIEENFKPLFNF